MMSQRKCDAQYTRFPSEDQPNRNFKSKECKNLVRRMQLIDQGEGISDGPGGFERSLGIMDARHVD